MKFDLPPEKRKAAIAAAVVAVALAGILFLTDMGKVLTGSVSSMLGLGGSDADQQMTAQTMPPPPPPAAPAEAKDEPMSEEAESLALALESGSVSLVEAVPGMQREPAWKALDRIAAWYAQPKSVKKEQVYSYLLHDKLWVRLAALQFLLAHVDLYAANADIIKATSHQLVRSEHPSQVRRFLKRAESIDLEVLSRMKKVLNL